MLDGAHRAYQWYDDELNHPDHGQVEAINAFVARCGRRPAYVAFKNTWLLPIPATEPEPQKEEA